MKYTKFEMGSYNLHIIKTDHFKTVNTRIMFKRKAKKEEINYRNFLSLMLLESTKKYKTHKEIEVKCEELYALNVRSESFLSGNYSVMSFDSVFLNEKYTEKGLFKEIFDFLFQLTLDPNVDNKAFDTNSFNNVKNVLINNLESYKDVPSYYSRKRILELAGKNTPLELKSEGYLETINEVNEKNLFEYYQKIIKTDNIDIFIIGDVDEEYLKKLIKETIPINTLKKPSETHYIEHKKIRKRALIEKEKDDFRQSQLLLAYKLDKLTDFEKQYVIPIYNYILGGAPDSKLFKNIREKKSLCYSISSGHIMIANLILITAGIDAKNYKKTVTLIRKQVKDMEKGLFDESDIEKAKLIFLNSYKELTDNPAVIMSIYMLHEYLNRDLLDDRIKKTKTVTKDMIVSVAKKVHLDTIFFLEGDNDEEEKN